MEIQRRRPGFIAWSCIQGLIPVIRVERTASAEECFVMLSHDVMQHISMNIRESEAPALEFEGELFVVDAHQMH